MNITGRSRGENAFKRQHGVTGGKLQEHQVKLIRADHVMRELRSA